MKKSSKKTVLVFACIFVLMSCLVLASALDVGGIRAKAAEVLYAAGDINGDGEVNGKDLTRLSKFMSGLNSGVVSSQLDTNKDGSINSNDITHLMRYLAGEIPELSETVYHTINFYDSITGYKETVYYSENEGYTGFPTRVAEGREFKGWSTEDNDINGEHIITSIPMGSKETYNLHACWTLKSYNIIYRYKENDIEKAVVNPNEAKYTMESEFEFKNPELSGLMFSHWTVTGKPETGEIQEYVDSTGTKRVKLTKGTTGDIELTAVWKSYKNLVVPKTKNRDVAVDFDPENDIYYFIYELGTVENVVLNPIAKPYDKSTNNPTTLTVSETITMHESNAQSVSNTIAEIVTRSNEWSTANEHSKEIAEEYGITITTGFQAGKEGVFAAKVEKSFGYTFGETDKWSTQETVGGGSEEGEEKTEEISSTVSYMKELTTTNQTSQEIRGDAPNGDYYFVHAGDVKVYAFVVYEPSTNKLYFDTYSILDNVHSTLLFEPGGYNEFETDALSYNIDLTAIQNKIRSGYYVKYEPNGGEGKMNLSVFSNTGENQLSKNNFEKTGYSLSGWRVGGMSEGKILEPEKKITDELAEPGHTVTLYAQWTANSYDVEFDVNGGDKLSDTEKVTVIYDSAYGKLPVPERKGYTFTGWKLGEEIISESSRVQTAENHKLVASWEINTYNIIYNLNEDKIYDEPVCAKETDKIIYGSDNVELAVPYCDIYTFEGWYNNPNGGSIISGADGKVRKWDYTDADKNGNINLYARWSTDYIFIEDRAGLEGIRNNLAGKYALIADIDLSGSDWEKLGIFTGVLDGNDHDIKNFTRSKVWVSDNGYCYGMFEGMKDALVKDINFTDVSISLYNNGNNGGSSYYVGTLAGQTIRSTVKNVVVSGKVEFPGSKGGSAYVGGIVGGASGSKFINCINKAHIYSAKGCAVSGGIVGEAAPDIETLFTDNPIVCEFLNCCNEGFIEARLTGDKGQAYTAGIVGIDVASFFDENCKNTGSTVPKDDGDSRWGVYKKNDIKNTR